MIVVDTSVIIKFVVPEIRSDAAARLSTESMFAPSVWMAEAANVFARKVRLKEFDAATADSLMQDLLNGPVRTVDIETYIRRALELSVELSHPAYDCIFLALAIQEGIFVVTDDTDFVTKVRRKKSLASHVKLLAET